MQIYYYFSEVPIKFRELGNCLAAAVKQANRKCQTVDVYRLIEHDDGMQEIIHVACIGPSKEL